MHSIKSFLLGSIFFLFSFPTQAQEVDLTGTVFSEEGVAIAEAHVYVSNSKWAITNESGEFIISSVEPGDYTLTISRVGFEEKRVEIEVSSDSFSPVTVYLREKIYQDDPVVVTASRTEQRLADVSVPIAVIDKEEILTSGNTRLSEILDEQLGLNIISDHGTGIQIQGFDPDYTLILIDNQPVIGRSAGTLDLTRLTVGNIQQIEVVKGPSSALWGSEALGGVINIITDKGSEDFTWDVSGRYANYNTYDAASNISFKEGPLSGRFFVNLNGSDGYDLYEETLAPTVAAYDNYTISGGLDYRLNKNITLKLGGRFYREDLGYPAEGTINEDTVLISGDQFQEDYNITPEIYWTIGDLQLLEFTSFFSGFLSETDEVIEELDSTFYFNSFDESLSRAEVKSSTFWSENQTTVLGLGYSKADLISDNYEDIPGFTSQFIYGQHELKFLDDFSVSLGARFDSHSEYASQFSPKFSALYKHENLFNARFSYGTGFKAPTFTQLYLNFTNATVGYSVFGTTTVVDGMNNLLETGQIQTVYIDAANVVDLKAETSHSFNLGFDITPKNLPFLKINIFRNNIQDLIDSQRIALKTNSQSVFSYFNLDKVYTQGIETELGYSPQNISGLSLGLGYQYLDARTSEEYNDIENGSVVTKTRYVILPNRSKHTGNLKLSYNLADQDMDFTVRAIHRGRYGLDANGNEKVDDDEYVNEASNLSEALEKTIINLSVAKTFNERFKFQFGVNNLTNFTDLNQPNYSGRIFYTQLNINLF